MTIEQLEPAAEWRAADIVDEAAWTLRFTDDEVVHNIDGVLSRIRQSIRYLPWGRASK